MPWFRGLGFRGVSGSFGESGLRDPGLRAKAFFFFSGFFLGVSCFFLCLCFQPTSLRMGGTAGGKVDIKNPA